MWRGAISFGMVAIPVRMYVATDSGGGVSFRLLCPHCQLPIKNQRHCPTDDHVVPWNETLRGYEVAKDRFVILTDEDLERLPLKTTKTIDILEFVGRDEIPMGVYHKSAYYLEPEEVGAKPYYLLKKALAETGRLAIGKIALRDREHLAAVQIHDPGLLLTTLNWPDEIRSMEELKLPEKLVKLSDKEVQMAVALVENLTAKFKPEQYKDDYKEAVQMIVEQKLAGQPIPEVAQPREAKVTDLMAALKASIEATKKTGKPAAPAARGERRTAAKSTAVAAARRRRTA
jgi:DNA end-binding protein Ku